MYVPSKEISRSAVASSGGPASVEQVRELDTAPVDLRDAPAGHALEVADQLGLRHGLQIGQGVRRWPRHQAGDRSAGSWPHPPGHTAVTE